MPLNPKSLYINTSYGQFYGCTLDMHYQGNRESSFILEVGSGIRQFDYVLSRMHLMGFTTSLKFPPNDKFDLNNVVLFWFSIDFTYDLVINIIPIKEYKTLNLTVQNNNQNIEP